MSDTDVGPKGLLVKYRENSVIHYMKIDPATSDIVGDPGILGAKIFTPDEATRLINLLTKQGFPFQCGTEAVK